MYGRCWLSPQLCLPFKLNITMSDVCVHKNRRGPLFFSDFFFFLTLKVKFGKNRLLHPSLYVCDVWFANREIGWTCRSLRNCRCQCCLWACRIVGSLLGFRCTICTCAFNHSIDCYDFMGVYLWILAGNVEKIMMIAGETCSHPRKDYFYIFFHKLFEELNTQIQDHS